MTLTSLARRALILVAALALTGCAGFQSSTQTVGPDRLDRAAAEVDGGHGLLSLTDGTRRRVEALRIERDTTSWIEPSTGALQVVPTPFVAGFEARDRRGAMFRGAGLGALVGATAGGALGLAVCADIGCETTGGIAVLGVAGAASGAFWGGALGALADPTHRWQFRLPEPAPTADD